MKLTEKEAKTKWCPMIRAGKDGNDPFVTNQHNCIGSHCMMWRWDSSPLAGSRLGECGLVQRKQRKE